MLPLTPVEVFYSYADADVPLLKQLEHHLSVLRRGGIITTWHARHILPGADWQRELDQHLNTAALILLLISPDFLASDYQYGVELYRALERHAAKEARVIPLLVRPCDWHGTPFGKLQALPRNGKAITTWHPRDAAFAEIAQEIRTMLEAVQQLTFSTLPTVLPKIWQIPYSRNPVFTGREDLLHTLADVLQTDHSAMLSQPQTQAISGLGGIGKTQLAIEYAYRAAQQYDAVFWVSAETQEILLAGYAALAEELNLPEKDEQDQNVMLQAVRRWLQTHTNWLLILDNADDLSLVEPLLPPMYGGRVLLTTRAQATGRFAHRIEVDTLKNEEGALLLLRRAGILSEQGAQEEASEEEIALARQMSTNLGDLPLALDQAGAYIEETGCSLLSYQQQYQKRQAFLLQRRGTFAADHPKPVATTWSLSFEKIEQASPIAVELLRFCAFLAPDAIPEELLVQGLTQLRATDIPEESKQEPGKRFSPLTSWHGKKQEEMSLDELPWEIDEAVAILRAYSLIQRNGKEKTLRVHRLVQAVLRDQMDQALAHQWTERTVRVVNAAFPSSGFSMWQQCERYLPHAQFCALLILQGEMTFQESADLLHRTGIYLNERARYKEAEPLLEQFLTIVERWLGSEHPNTSVCLNDLAIVCLNQDKYAEAESLLQRALAINERNSGIDHPSVATILNNLTAVYRKQGKYTEAEQLLQWTLSVLEQHLGASYPAVATVLNNLSIVYLEQNKHVEVEPLLQRARTICEEHLGLTHPHTAICLNNLATIYLEQSKYTEAESLLYPALVIITQQLGLEHPDTRTILRNYIFFLRRAGQEARAIQLEGQLNPFVGFQTVELPIQESNEEKTLLVAPRPMAPRPSFPHLHIFNFYLDKFTSYDTLRGITFRGETFQQAIQGYLPKLLHFFRLTFRDSDYRRTIRVPDPSSKYFPESKRSYKNLPLGEVLFGYEVLNRKAFWKIQERSDGMWQYEYDDEGRHVIDWSKFNNVRNKIILLKQWVMMKIVSLIYIHIQLHREDPNYNRRFYLNVIKALEDIPGDILSYEYNIIGKKPPRCFFSKADLSWLRNMVRIEHFDLYWVDKAQELLSPSSPNIPGALEVLGLVSMEAKESFFLRALGE